MAGHLRQACAAMLCPNCGEHVTFERGPNPPTFVVTAVCEPCKGRWTWELPKVPVTLLPWETPKVVM